MIAVDWLWDPSSVSPTRSTSRRLKSGRRVSAGCLQPWFSPSLPGGRLYCCSIRFYRQPSNAHFSLSVPRLFCTSSVLRGTRCPASTTSQAVHWVSCFSYKLYLALYIVPSFSTPHITWFECSVFFYLGYWL